MSFIALIFITIAWSFLTFKVIVFFQKVLFRPDAQIYGRLYILVNPQLYEKLAKSDIGIRINGETCKDDVTADKTSSEIMRNINRAMADGEGVPVQVSIERMEVGLMGLLNSATQFTYWERPFWEYWTRGASDIDDPLYFEVIETKFDLRSRKGFYRARGLWPQIIQEVEEFSQFEPVLTEAKWKIVKNWWNQFSVGQNKKISTHGATG
jgi:hypothetical protein